MSVCIKTEGLSHAFLNPFREAARHIIWEMGGRHIYSLCFISFLGGDQDISGKLNAFCEREYLLIIGYSSHRNEPRPPQTIHQKFTFIYLLLQANKLGTLCTQQKTQQSPSEYTLSLCRARCAHTINPYKNEQISQEGLDLLWLQPDHDLFLFEVRGYRQKS